MHESVVNQTLSSLKGLLETTHIVISPFYRKLNLFNPLDRLKERNKRNFLEEKSNFWKMFFFYFLNLSCRVDSLEVINFVFWEEINVILLLKETPWHTRFSSETPIFSLNYFKPLDFHQVFDESERSWRSPIKGCFR